MNAIPSITVCVFCLLAAGCDDKPASKPIPSRSATVAAQSDSGKTPKQPDDTKMVFPKTPEEAAFSSKGLHFSNLAQAELIQTFVGGDDETWAFALKEMSRRRTAECLNSMASNITIARGATSVSGEYIYGPAHSSPVAIALIECGNDAKGALIQAAKDVRLDRKTRILNMWVLKQLASDALVSTDWFSPDTLSIGERQELSEILKIASDQSLLSEHFPQIAPHN